MLSEAAARLKVRWIDGEMSNDCFEPLTFGELEVGQKFISFPSPGDNNGHGGFRGTFWIFRKTDQVITEINGLPYHSSHPHGRAVNICRGIPSDFPDSMFVIRVQ